MEVSVDIRTCFIVLFLFVCVTKSLEAFLADIFHSYSL